MNAYAWIPILGNELPVLSNHYASTKNKYVFDDEGHPRHIDAVVRCEDNSCLNLSIDIMGSILKYDGTSSNQSFSDAVNSTYYELKRCFHTHVSHDSDGLEPVWAVDEKDAVNQIALQLLNHSNVTFIFNNRYDIEELQNVYLYSVGCIEYGLNFIELYKDILGDRYSWYRENFISYHKFVDMRYNCARDRASYRLSESNYMLSGAVVILSLLSIGISVAALFQNIFTIPSEIVYLQVVVFLIVGFVSVIYFLKFREIYKFISKRR